MSLKVNKTDFSKTVDAFRAWSRWPGRDEARLRLIVEGGGIKTTILYADTGEVPETMEHPHKVERMWVDIS